ncbi:MAG TPA: hypothetical protein VFF80_03150 [Bacillota bacterium]|nr:hypothetical protein [Bacillota bacterium]
MQETLKILLIEDSKLDAELILAKLSEAKISVEHCLIDNAREMQKQLERQEWDIAIADAYDAMTSERSYQRGLSKEEAVTEIKRCSGKQFDPEIVSVFLKQVLTDSVFETGDSTV